MKRYLIAGVLLAALLSASFFLPSRIMEWQDRQRIGNSESEEVPELILKEQAPMTLIERLILVQRVGEQVDTLELINGKNFTQHTMEEQVLKELKSLAELGIIQDVDLDGDSAVFVMASVSLYLDLEDTEKSVMLWSGEMDVGNYYLNFQLDDESGKIVSFSQYYQGDVVPVSQVRDYGSEDDAMWGAPYEEAEEAVDRAGSVVVAESRTPLSVEELKEMAERWGDYLGCTVTDAGYSHFPMELVGEDEVRFREEVERMMMKGWSEEEAMQRIALQWGFYGDETWEQRRVLLSDAGEEIEYALNSSIDTRIHISIL